MSDATRGGELAANQWAKKPDTALTMGTSRVVIACDKPLASMAMILNPQVSAPFAVAASPPRKSVRKPCTAFIATSIIPLNPSATMDATAPRRVITGYNAPPSLTASLSATTKLDKDLTTVKNASWNGAPSAAISSGRMRPVSERSCLVGDCIAAS